jgi:hypothetical protein
VPGKEGRHRRGRERGRKREERVRIMMSGEHDCMYTHTTIYNYII